MLYHLFFPVQLTQAFLAITRVRVVDWYVEQGLKVEQELRRNFLFWGFFVCAVTFLCLASHFGRGVCKPRGSYLGTHFSGG